MVDSLRGIDDHRGLGISFLIFISVCDPKTPFVEHLTLVGIDRWSRSIGPEGAFLMRVDTKISFSGDFLDGVVAWQVNLHKRRTIKGVHDYKGIVLHPISQKS